MEKQATERLPGSRSTLPTANYNPVLELRQYTLKPGKRDTLIELFDREFIESQEALGMQIIGQFRVIDQPDLFVWLRGFWDMQTRAEALQSFYEGPVWGAHRDLANATMIDFSNVLLLSPAHGGSGFSLENTPRPPRDAVAIPNGLVTATIYPLNTVGNGDFVTFFERSLVPVMTNAGASILAYFVTEHSPNDFPRLPVREGENVFVWFSGFPTLAAYERYVELIEQSWPQQTEIQTELARRLTGPPEMLRLVPTARSRLR